MIFTNEDNRVTSEEGGEITNNNKGEEVGDNDNKTRDIAKKNEEGECHTFLGFWTPHISKMGFH